MKTADIIKTLKANKGVSDYIILNTDTERVELYYVLKHLEINRCVNVNNTTANVIVADGKTTGTSIVNITAADDEKTLSKKIKDAVKKAKLAKNPYYPMVEKSENITQEKPKDISLDVVASEVAKAIQKADKYDNAWINSAEIFISRKKKQFISSKGIKHTTYGFKIEIEVIPTATDGKNEYEQYMFYSTSSTDYKTISQKVEDIILNARDRAIAKKLDEIKIGDDVKILVQDDMLSEIADCLSADASYRSVFTKSNHYKIDDVISNNPFDITLSGVVDGCVSSCPIDENGIVLKDTKIISKGKLISLHGGQQFGYYLGEKNITGNHPIVVVDGKRTDYKDGKYLVIEQFSSPQLEESTGYWGGEVRLARYYDGEKMIPLTGFSISGNLYEDIKEVQFSKENETLDYYKGPKYFIFKGISLH